MEEEKNINSDEVRPAMQSPSSNAPETSPKKKAKNRAVRSNRQGGYKSQEEDDLPEHVKTPPQKRVKKAFPSNSTTKLGARETSNSPTFLLPPRRERKGALAEKFNMASSDQ
jgi:hypothetical protein